MTLQKIEDDLLIWSWGRWARHRIDRELGCKEAPWAYMMKTGSGYDMVLAAPPVAPDGWCERIDRMIASMGEDVRVVMVGLYCLGVSRNSVARFRNISTRQVDQIRGACLNQLFGALFLSEAV